MRTIYLLITALLAGVSIAQEAVDVTPAVNANTEFAVDLYGRLRGQDGNLCLSPYGISSALAMTYGGARGNTEKQMAAVLHFAQPPEQLHRAFAALQSRFQAIQQNKQVKLTIANALWPQRGYDFLPAFLTLCREHYAATTAPLDYKSRPEKARQTINQWVEQKTDKRIRELFAPGSVDAQTRLVLANAVYFKGMWRTQLIPK